MQVKTFSEILALSEFDSRTESILLCSDCGSKNADNNIPVVFSDAWRTLDGALISKAGEPFGYLTSYSLGVEPHSFRSKKYKYINYSQASNSDLISINDFFGFVLSVSALADLPSMALSRFRVVNWIQGTVENLSDNSQMFGVVYDPLNVYGFSFPNQDSIHFVRMTHQTATFVNLQIKPQLGMKYSICFSDTKVRVANLNVPNSVHSPVEYMLPDYNRGEYWPIIDDWGYGLTETYGYMGGEWLSYDKMRFIVDYGTANQSHLKLTNSFFAKVRN